MNPLTIFLIIIIAVAAFFLYHFFRGSFRSAESRPLDKIEDDPKSYLNHRDSSHDDKL